LVEGREVAKVSGIYNLVATEEEYRKAYDFLREEECKHKRLSFPTIVKKNREDVIEALIGTIESDKAVIAGPMLVHDKGQRPGFTVIRLIEAYEGVLTSMGISSYIFRVDKENRKFSHNIEMAELVDIFAETSKSIWYKKEIGRRVQ
jgi:hypothetical protein